jgi:hypothetical protein
MNNVVPLFQDMKTEGPADAESRVTIAIANVIALNTKLIRRVNEFSKHLDAVDAVAKSLEDRDAGERLMHLSRIRRESLAQLVSELSYHLGRLPALLNEFVRDQEPMEQ